MATASTPAIVRCGLAGALLAGLLIGVLAYGAGQLGPARVGAFTTTYDGRVLDDPLELLLVQSDGQAFASLARDPLLARPEVFRSDAEAAYRAQRPLLGYAAWAGSLGRTGWVPPALAIISAAGAGLAIAALARLLVDRGIRPAWSLTFLIFPGTYMALSFAGPEPLAAGFALWGIVAYGRSRILTAVVLFALAALCRESLLLVPAALALEAAWRGRIRRSAALALAAAPYAAWVVVLHWRIGAWPTGAGHGRVDVPFAGLVSGLRNPADDGTILNATLCVAAGVLAMIVARHDPLSWVVALHLAFATTMGELVWMTWQGFGRVLVPLNAVSLVLLAGFTATRYGRSGAHADRTRRWPGRDPAIDRCSGVSV